MLWGVSVPILAPFAILPLPNLPCYYAAYRTYSLYQAWTGSKALIDAFTISDLQQQLQLCAQLEQCKEAGTSFPASSWPEQLLASQPQLHQRLGEALQEQDANSGQEGTDDDEPSLKTSGKRDDSSSSSAGTGAGSEVESPEGVQQSPFEFVADERLTGLIGTSGQEEVASHSVIERVGTEYDVAAPLHQLYERTISRMEKAKKGG